MLFEKNWDTTLIDKFELIRKEFDKPIITTYTPWWSMTDGAINFYSNVSEAFCAPMVLDLESSTKDGYPKPKTKHSDWLDREVYKEHHFISAHFLFTDPSFIQEVLPDPLIMYSGEVITTAVRAWTRGYRMFCIKNPIAWHLNKFHGDRYSKDRLWDSKNTGPLYDHFMKKNEKGAQRSKDILTGKITGYWGAETIDLLKGYEEASGLDFKSLYEEIGK
jgi:hypothetical protein